MNPVNTVQMLQKGFHITLGATTSLIESLQDPQKRQENLSNLRLEFNELTQVWEEKGLSTEQEARRLVDTLMQQRNSTPTSASPSNTPPATPASAQVQEQLHELTSELEAIRMELENSSQKPEA